MSPQRHILSLKRFAKLIGFKTARASGFHRTLEDLKTLKVIEVQQSGYAAHSESHLKIVVIRDMQRIQELHVPSRRPVSIGKRVKNIVIRTAQVISKRLDVTVLMRVVGTQESPGIYLHIPKDHVEAYGIKSGDRLEAQLVRVFSVVWV